MKKFTVAVTTEVDVELDESKFTEEFMQGFRDGFYDFHDLEAHAKHLGQLYARGLADNRSFIEGYGEAPDMGIVFTGDDIQIEIV